MKNRKIFNAIIAAAFAIVLTGCSQGTPEESSLPTGEPIESQSVTQESQNQIVEVSIPATITVNCVYADGAPDLVVYLDVNGVSSKLDENNDSIIYGYDKDDNLIYKMEDSSVKDADGALNVTSVYEFYSLKYDFDFRMEPLGPENVESIHTISGSIVTRNESGETSKDFSYENVGVRGQTGIWYAGICSCRDGALTDYIAQ